MPEVNAGPALADTIEVVRGRFASDAALQDAVGRLTRAGFDRAALALPAEGGTTPETSVTDPNMADDQRQVRTLGTSSAAAAGAMLGAAVTVATGGAAALAVAAAAGMGLAAGGTAYAATEMNDASDHAGREAAAASGALILSVTVRDAAQAAKAEAAISAAGGTAIERVRRD